MKGGICTYIYKALVSAVRIIAFDGFGEEIKSEERKDGQFKF